MDYTTLTAQELADQLRDEVSNLNHFVHDSPLCSDVWEPKTPVGKKFADMRARLKGIEAAIRTYPERTAETE